MQIDKLRRFYEGLKSEGIIFSFSGPLSQAILESIGETVRRKMQLESTGFGTIQRVFAILVEQAQNILCYSAEVTSLSEDGGEEHIRMGVLALGIENERYYVCCGNYIPIDKVKQLSKELTMIQGMEPEALRQLYMKKRKMDPPADSKGAGLGLIEIARRSNEPVTFDIHPMNGKFAFLAVKAVI